MEQRIITATDLGSSKISVSVAKVIGRDVQVIYHKKRPSRGIRYSTVFNPQQASEEVSAAIKDAETALNIKINSTLVGLPRYGIVQKIGEAGIQRTDPRSSITKEELDALQSDAIETFPVNEEADEMVFGAVTQSFSVGDRISYPEQDIIGMTGETVSGIFKLFIGKKKNFNDLNSVFSRAGLAVSRRYFTPDITARAALTESEMENGVAVIDLGAGASSLTIYEGRIIRYYACIPFGGNTITNDIKLESSISSVLAENIKLAFGVCKPDSLQNLNEKVIQLTSDEISKPKHLPIRFLSEIIEARITEIFEALLYEIQRSGYADSLRSGIVLTGGGANLAGCKSLLNEISGYTVRIGWPRRNFFIADGCPEAFDPSATTSLGMILAARDNEHIISTNDTPTLCSEEDREEEIPPVEPIVNENVKEETLFDPSEGQISKEELERRREEKKKEKANRPRPAWSTIDKITTGINVLGNLFNNFYDGVHEEDEEEENK